MFGQSSGQTNRRKRRQLLLFLWTSTTGRNNPNICLEEYISIDPEPDLEAVRVRVKKFQSDGTASSPERDTAEGWIRYLLIFISSSVDIWTLKPPGARKFRHEE